MPVTPEQIIAEARALKGTPYGHQGRTPGKIIDCIGVPICILKKLNARDEEFFKILEQEYRAYSRASLGNSLYDACKRFIPEVPPYKRQPSDLVLFLMDKELRHAAILTERNTVIHAYAEVGECVEHVYSEKWQLSTFAVFRLSEF